MLCAAHTGAPQHKGQNYYMCLALGKSNGKRSRRHDVEVPEDTRLFELISD